MSADFADWRAYLSALAEWLSGDDLADALAEQLDKLERRSVISAAAARDLRAAFDLAE